MAQGTIKKLTPKGFGFIEGEQGDLFFHSTEVKGTTFENLREGQQVQYQVGMGKKGPCANGVTPV
jgi:CspA family cold shock protein